MLELDKPCLLARASAASYFVTSLGPSPVGISRRGIRVCAREPARSQRQRLVAEHGPARATCPIFRLTIAVAYNVTAGELVMLQHLNCLPAQLQEARPAFLRRHQGDALLDGARHLDCSLLTAFVGLAMPAPQEAACV